MTSAIFSIEHLQGPVWGDFVRVRNGASPNNIVLSLSELADLKRAILDFEARQAADPEAAARQVRT